MTDDKKPRPRLDLYNIPKTKDKDKKKRPKNIDMYTVLNRLFGKRK